MTQEMPITAEFIWTFDEMKAMQEALIMTPVTPKSKPLGFSWITCVLLPVAIILMIMGNSINFRFPTIDTIKDNLPVIFIYMIPVLVLWAVFSYAQKNNLKKAFINGPDSNKRIHITLTPDEVVLTSQALETRLEWTRFTEVRRTSKGFCFLQTPQTGLWIPIRAFKSHADVESVSEMARRLTPKFTAANN